MNESVYRKSVLRTTIPIGILLGWALSFGMYLERDGMVAFSDPMVYLLWLAAALAASVGLILLWLGLDAYANRAKVVKDIFPCTRKQWLLVFGALVLCYSITFLGVFPGFFAYDAKMAHWQVYYGQITTQHPWIHTLLLGNICEFSSSHLGHANVGIALYIYVQMLFVAGCFTYTLYAVRRRVGQSLVFYVSFLFYAFFPTIHMFALCSTKDTPFTAVMLVWIVLLWDMFEDKKGFFESKPKVIAFVLFGLGFLVLRKNALYAVIVFMPFFLAALGRYWRKGALALGAVFVMLWIYDGPLASAAGVVDIGPKEALSVPSQQLARVYNEDREVFSEEELKQLETFYPPEFLEMYMPKLADYTKGMLNTEYFQDNIGDYLKLWASVGMRAPDIYVNATLINTYGFWYPMASLDGYTGFGGMKDTVLENAENYYFAYVTEEPGERVSLIPAIDSLYYKLSTTNLHKKLPGISLLFSPGFLFWLFAAAAAYSVHRKRKEYYPAFVLMGLLWLTVQLGPIALVRYVLFLFFGVPFVLSAMFRRADG